MKLHQEPKLFADAIRSASSYLKISPDFIEKDYWITLVLSNLSKTAYSNQVVFKGGTSLSKAYNLIHRFSEDVDLAVITNDTQTGNYIKTLIRKVEKSITGDMEGREIEGITSKGSQFRKSVFFYPTQKKSDGQNKLIVEINSFANPFPFVSREIESFIGEFFRKSDNATLVDKYGLEPFLLNVLDKRQTLAEKMVSLIRVSYEQEAIEGITSKIRHFYDPHYLLEDKECQEFIKSKAFQADFNRILEHDKLVFDEPLGWATLKIEDSPLLNNYPFIWSKIAASYTEELSKLAFREIPPQKEIAETFDKIKNHLFKTFP